MLGLGGIYRGSGVLITGVPGSGKTIFGASFAAAPVGAANAAYFSASRESAELLVRNVGSAGIDLQPHIEAGLLRFETKRPTSFGFEMHLAHMQRELDRFKPSSVIIDPVTSFSRVPTARSMPCCCACSIFSRPAASPPSSPALTNSSERVSQSDLGLSTLMDTWISLVGYPKQGERNRGLYALKSRGMNHSNQIREYLLTSNGVKLVEAYLGVDGVLTGSARLAMEAQERVESQQHIEEASRLLAGNWPIAAPRPSANCRTSGGNRGQDSEIARLAEYEQRRETVFETDRAAMGASRGMPSNDHLSSLAGGRLLGRVNE